MKLPETTKRIKGGTRDTMRKSAYGGQSSYCHRIATQQTQHSIPLTLLTDDARPFYGFLDSSLAIT